MLGISISQIGSSLAGIMFILATIQQFCPTIVYDFFSNMLARLIALFRSDIEINFYEFESSSSYRTSGAYLAVEAYVGDLSMDLTNYASRLKANKADKRSSTKSLIYALEDFEVINDEFQGVQFSWLAGVLHPQGKISMSYDPWSAEKRYFRLTFHAKYRRLVTKEYLTHVMEEGESILKKRKTRMLYTNNPSSEWEDYKKGIWRKYVFEHPATFDNLAMDPLKKQEIIQDLINFTKAKDYYKKIGKAWKRGYLLYGPPGTGKTTMIACMANLLGYDVYDLELTTIANNSELRNILISTGGKSIILIEDIDCTISVTAKRDEKSDDNDDDDSDSDDDNAKKGGNNGNKKAKNKNRITLSGLLNVIDGLWSPCSQERIIVFTTNHIDKLDPALIRTGRMDKHIEMSYCTFEAFKIFAKNYLDIDSHPFYDRIEKLLSETNISPSDVAENLMPKSGNEEPERRLQAVIRAIEEKQR